MKESRDALVHGMFALTDNTNPNVVVVIYKHGKKSFHLMDLRQIGDRIGIANVSLKSFDQWVDYASTLASFKKLAQQEHR